MSKLFKVTATMDVGYQLFIRAENEEDAMEKAKDLDGDYWEKTEGFWQKKTQCNGVR